MIAEEDLKFAKWSVIAALVAAAVGIGAIIAPFVFADEPTVEVSWREGGQINIERFGPESEWWMTFTQGSTTTVGWMSGTSTPESFVFMPDEGRWRVGERPVRGDMNENGVLDYGDVRILFDEVTGR